mgnify:CR=1 FL=1
MHNATPHGCDMERERGGCGGGLLSWWGGRCAGTHAPTGDISLLAGLQVSAGGKPVVWTRDTLDVYAFHVDVPAGVSETPIPPATNRTRRAGEP